MQSQKLRPKPVAREHRAFRTREDGHDRIEVHVAGACLFKRNGQWRVLAAQRKHTRDLYPDRWECGGGAMRKGEGFEAGIRRKIFEEFGLTVLPYYILESYDIPSEAQVIIPGLRWVCLVVGGKIQLNKKQFSRYRWLSFPVPKLNWIPGVEEALNSIALEQLPDPAKTIPEELPPRKQPLGFVPNQPNKSALAHAKTRISKTG